MTLPRAFDLMGAWGEAPPVHLMMAAYFGIGGKEAKNDAPARKEVASEEDWEALANAMGTTLQRTKREPQQP